MNDCIFCKVAEKEVLAEIIYEDNNFIAFNDINPQAPRHFLVITKQHFETINDIENKELIGKLHSVAIEIAKKEGFAEKGYRLVINCNEDGSQSVRHIHLHCLAGRKMCWPPG